MVSAALQVRRSGADYLRHRLDKHGAEYLCSEQIPEPSVSNWVAGHTTPLVDRGNFEPATDKFHNFVTVATTGNDDATSLLCPAFQPVDKGRVD
jgi:hypothetical protein